LALSLWRTVSHDLRCQIRAQVVGVSDREGCHIRAPATVRTYLSISICTPIQFNTRTYVLFVRLPYTSAVLDGTYICMFTICHIRFKGSYICHFKRFMAQVVRGTMSKLAGCSPTYKGPSQKPNSSLTLSGRSNKKTKFCTESGLNNHLKNASDDAIPINELKIITRIHFNALTPTFLGSGREGYHVRACRLQSHLQ